MIRNRPSFGEVWLHFVCVSVEKKWAYFCIFLERLVGVCVFVKREREGGGERERCVIYIENRRRERDKRGVWRSLRSVVASIWLLFAVALCIGCPESEVVTKKLHD